DERLRKAADRVGNRFSLKQRLPAGPTDVSDFGGGIRAAGEVQDPLRRVLDADPREVSAFDRMHRVAPAAAEVAGVQPHEDGRQADERALALDGDVQPAQAEALPLA